MTEVDKETTTDNEQLQAILGNVSAAVDDESEEFSQTDSEGGLEEVSEYIEPSHEVQVLKTTNLDIFKRLPTQRPTSTHRVKQIAKSLKEDNQLFRYPIEVTQNRYVVDGEHRKGAVQLLHDEGDKIPIYFTVRPDVEHDPDLGPQELSSAEKAMIFHNSRNNRNWGLEPFLNLWIEKDNESYQFLQEKRQNWKDEFETSISIGAMLRMANCSSTAFKEGKLTIDYSQFNSRLNDLKKVAEFYPDISSAKTVSAFLTIREYCDNFNIDRLVGGLKSLQNNYKSAQKFEHRMSSSAPRDRALALIDQHNKGMMDKNKIKTLPVVYS